VPAGAFAAAPLRPCVWPNCCSSPPWTWPGTFTDMPAKHWETVYRTTSSALPWEEKVVPQAVEQWGGLLSPGDSALDIGCGRGQNAISLGLSGIHVDGVDFSPAAIAAARKAAARARVDFVRFTVADILTFMPDAPYDLVFDYSVFHHIHERDRVAYADSVRRAVRSGGYFGLVCYSPDDPDAGGRASRISAWGNRIFHPRLEDVVALFGDGFELLDYGPSALGRLSNHRAQRFLFRRAH
jgi:SAM-dependent methyltransferase